MTETNLAFQAQIYEDMEALPNRIRFPDRSNQGKLLAMLAMWKKVEQIAGKKYDTLMSKLVGEEMIKDPKSIEVPGTHTIGMGGSMEVKVNVSVPRREFNLEWFAAQMHKKHKVPVAATKALYEEAKRPGTSQTRKITVQEKGIDL